MVQAYDEFFAKLKEKESIKLKPEEWAFLSLSLPKTLVEKDVILMSLRTPAEIVDRLKQMRGLERYQRSTEDLEVINYLIEKLPAVADARRVVCYDLMRKLPQYRAASIVK